MGDAIIPWLVYACIAAFYGLVSGLMTVYYGPGAMGSGVAEIIGFLNGVNYPEFLNIKTLITKIIGVTLSVSGRLCVGKEGPLAHIGAIIGVGVLYLPGLDLRFLRNDENKRLFAAAGASTGVSVAFGAPIGGALFCYELSQPNTFWKFAMIWKVFFSCAIGTFTLAVCEAIKIKIIHPHIRDVDFLNKFTGSALKFGTISSEGANILELLFAGVILGVLGGLLGSFFIAVNTWANKLRKMVLTKNWYKPIESAAFCFLSASVFFWCIYQTKVFDEKDDKWCQKMTEAEYNEH